MTAEQRSRTQRALVSELLVIRTRRRNPTSKFSRANQKRMPLISVTRLRVRSWRFMPAFLFYTYKSAQQARHAPGFLGGALVSDRNRTFWTITLWDSEASMRAYRSAEWHKRVMPKLVNWCDEASVVHWSELQAQVPSVLDAYERMLRMGRPSRVDRPSPNHESMRIPAPGAVRPAPLRPVRKAQAA